MVSQGASPSPAALGAVLFLFLKKELIITVMSEVLLKFCSVGEPFVAWPGELLG